MIGIHYDIYPNFNESVNIILFEALVLRSIKSGDDFIFHMPENAVIYLEMSHSLNREFEDHKLFFNFFQTREMIWDPSKIKVDNDPKSYFQILCRYLQAIDANAIKINDLRDSEVPIPPDACCQLLDKYYLSSIAKPNFYLLQSFIALASSQFKKMLESPFFTTEEIM